MPAMILSKFAPPELGNGGGGFSRCPHPTKKMRIPLICGTTGGERQLAAGGNCPVCQLPTLALIKHTENCCFFFIPMCPLSSSEFARCLNCGSTLPTEVFKSSHGNANGSTKNHPEPLREPLILPIVQSDTDGGWRRASNEHYPFAK